MHTSACTLSRQVSCTPFVDSVSPPLLRCYVTARCFATACRPAAAPAPAQVAASAAAHAAIGSAAARTLGSSAGAEGGGHSSGRVQR